MGLVDEVINLWKGENRVDKLMVDKNDYNKIINHCQQKKPKEACGILGGEKDENKAVVKEVYLMKNVENSSEHYLMEPDQQFEVFRDLRENELELVSIFHSHPHTEAVPSTEDLEMAHYPEAIYTIISLENEEVDLRAYLIGDEDYQEISVVIN